MKSLPVFAIGTLQGPPFIATIGGVIQLGRSTTLQCTVMSTVPETVTVDWTTTAVSANISNQTINTFFSIVSELLHLANVDSGYCGVYTCTCTVADADMIPMSASISLSVGEYMFHCLLAILIYSVVFKINGFFFINFSPHLGGSFGEPDIFRKSRLRSQLHLQCQRWYW